MGKLLNNLSDFRLTHTGYRAWVQYLEGRGIEWRTESDGSTTFIGENDEGKRTRLDPASIVADVRAAYYEAMHELGEEVEEPERPAGQPRMTRSSFVSVMD
jgi:hypothetical protein